MSSKDRKSSRTRTSEQGDYEINVGNKDKKKSSFNKEERSTDRKHRLGDREMDEDEYRYKINKNREDGKEEKEERRSKRTGKEENTDDRASKGNENESYSKQRHHRVERKDETTERDKTTRKRNEEELNDSKRNKKKEKEVEYNELERRHRKEPSEELNELKRHRKKEKDVDNDEREKRQLKEREKETNETRRPHKKENELDELVERERRSKRSKETESTRHDRRDRGEEPNEIKSNHRRGSDTRKEEGGNGKNEKEKIRHRSRTGETGGENKSKTKRETDEVNREELIDIADQKNRRKHVERAERKRDKGEEEPREHKAKQRDSRAEVDEIDYDDDFDNYDEEELEEDDEGVVAGGGDGASGGGGSSGGSMGLGTNSPDAGQSRSSKSHNITSSNHGPPDGPIKPIRPIGQFQSSFINFRTAQKKYSHDLVANRMLSRAFDLSRLIEMDRVEYDILEIAPVLEHSQYMRLFGKAGCVHDGSQTGSDNVSRESQTEAVDERVVWTQCPPLDDHECFHIVCDSEHRSDGDVVEYRSDGSKPMATDSDEMVLRSGALKETLLMMDRVLEEEASCDVEILMSDQSQLNGNQLISKGYSKFRIPEGIDCLIARFAVANSNIFATVHQPSQLPHPTANDSSSSTQQQSAAPSIGIWKVSRCSSEPLMELACPTSGDRCHSTVTQLTFSPDPAASHVICGLTNGALALWDLRESSDLRSRQSKLSAAYLTSASADDEGGFCHQGSIVGLQPLISRMDSHSYQLICLDSCGQISIWMVSHIAQLNQWSLASGSLNDLNLRPGARYRLSRVASMHLVSSFGAISNPYVITSVTLDPACSTHLFCGTNTGQIIHHKRAPNQRITNNRSISQPRSLGGTNIFETGTVTQLDFYPFFEPYLLAGYDDGSIRIFAVGRSTHLLAFHHKPSSAILQLKWSRSHPAIFFSLDVEGNLCAWNILLNQNHPLQVQSLPGYIGFDVSSDSKWEFTDRTAPSPQININNKARLLLWALDGRVEVHELSDAFSNPELDDSFKTSSLFQSLI